MSCCNQFSAALVKSKKHLGIYIVVIILVSVVAALVLQLQMFISGGVIYLFNVICPFSAFLAVIDLAMKATAAGGTLNWNNLDSGDPLSGRSIFAGHAIDLILWLVLMILMHLCMKPAFGNPPIGWRNLLKIRSWKRLLRKRRRSRGEIRSSGESIRFAGLRKVYGETVALDDVSLSIRAGEVIIAIGPNGAGKSTLIDTLIGAQAATSGTIFVFDEQIEHNFGRLYTHLGIVFQDNCLLDNFNCIEHLRLFGEMHGYEGAELEDTVNTFMSMFQVGGCSNTLAKTLSGGEKRKLCIAIALLSHPSILILDEPTAGVDAQSRQLIWKAISRFQNMTALVSAHSLEEAESISSRMVVMKSGKIAFLGTAAELRSQYHCGYNLTFLGDDLDLGAVLNRVREVVPEAVVHEDHPRTLLIPSDLRVVDALDVIENEKERLGCGCYTVQLENLEETLRKLIEDEEVLTQAN
jgi:ABC-type multidrug transport system ATPase subunit